MGHPGKLTLTFLITSLLTHSVVVGTTPENLSVFPTSVQLTSSRQTVQLIVTGQAVNGQILDLTHEATFTPSDPSLLKITPTGMLTPLLDGTTSIQVTHGQLNDSISVEISGQDSQEAVSFNHQVLPVLAKAGCSSGQCHGAPHGKAGFQLSLFAFAPNVDRVSLVRQSFGRRVNPITPSESLLLLKPTMKLSHQGGKRLETDGRLYQLLHDWMGEGCSVTSHDTTCLGIRVFPPEDRVLKFPHINQQFRVVAEFSDGTSRDVSHLAKYETSDPNVASVTSDGLVTGLGRGDAAVIIRYLSHIQTPLLTFVRDIPGFAWEPPPIFNYIDENVDRKLRQLQYRPSNLCSDETFVRRAYLDVIGLLPTPTEVNHFLESDAASKRSELVDSLLQRPEYARFWAQKWGDLLRVSRKLIGGNSVMKYNRWLQNAVAKDMPYDQFVKALLTASGSTLTHPQGNYYRTAGDTNDAMETTSQLFLGSRIQCAKCHNHPFERWTQDNYYGLASFFHRLQRRKTGREEEILLYSTSNGEVTHPQSGRVMQPWVPTEGSIDVPEHTDRRNAFVDWLVTPENPFFAKVEVNRIWAQLIGRGIVEPFDDFRDSNPPANAPLLEALANDFTAHQFDRKTIIRRIMNSRIYQTASKTNRFNQDDYKYFSHYTPRRLSAEQLVDALGQVTGRPKTFERVAHGTKATWLPAPDLKPHQRDKIGDIEFLKVFGQPERQSACSCERKVDTSLGQALELLNGQFLHDMLIHPENRFRQSRKAGTSLEEIILDLYRWALCRKPTDQELQRAVSYVNTSENQEGGMEDVTWAILNKEEFLFQH